MILEEIYPNIINNEYNEYLTLTSLSIVKILKESIFNNIIYTLYEIKYTNNQIKNEL